MPVDKNITYDNPVVQGGVDNYLGKQPQVQAPRKWQSAPDKPATELAYITEAEKDLILKANIHGGLEGGPNMGPSGIMSLDSFGDIGGAGASGGDTSASGGAMDGRGFSGRNTNTTSEREFDRQKANQRAALQIAERAQAKNLGYKERQNIADKTYGPMQKYSGDGFLGGYKGGGRKGGLGGILGTIVGMMMGIPGLGLLTGGFGRLREGLGSLGDTIGDTLGNFREKTTGFRTQAEYDAARQQRQLQSRLDNLYDRKATGKGFSQKNIDMLESKYGLSPSRDTITSAINKDLQTNPETPQFARSYLQSVAKNLPTSNPFRNTVGTTANTTNDAVSSTVPQGIAFNNPVGGLDQYAKEMEALESMVSPPLPEFNLPGLSYNIPINEMGGTVQQYYTQNPPDRKYLTKDGKVQIYNDGINFNTQPQGTNTIDVGYPSNDLMAGLTKIQQRMLAGPQKNLRNIMGISDQEILDNISPFNDPEDPATLEEVQTFYGADGGLASMFTRRG